MVGWFNGWMAGGLNRRMFRSQGNMVSGCLYGRIAVWLDGRMAGW